MPEQEHPQRRKISGFALDVLIDVLRDCNRLREFKQTHKLSNARWNSFSVDVRYRLSALKYVKFGSDGHMHLTSDGLRVLEYRESTG